MSSGNLSLEIRPRRAISAQAKEAPCHVLSAMAGRSYMLATATEWMENRFMTVSNTCSTNTVGRRSAIRATPFAADHLTMVSWTSIQKSRVQKCRQTLSCKPSNICCKISSTSVDTSCSSSLVSNSDSDACIRDFARIFILLGGSNLIASLADNLYFSLRTCVLLWMSVLLSMAAMIEKKSGRE